MNWDPVSEPKAPLNHGAILLGRRAGERTITSLPAVQLAVACAGGILVASQFQFATLAWLAIAVLLGFLVALRRHRWLADWAMCGVAFCVMAAWMNASKQPPPSDDIANWAPQDFQPVVLRATVASAVELRPNPLLRIRADATRFKHQSVVELKILSVRDNEKWTTASGRVHAVVQGDVTDLLIGDAVIAFGKIQHIGPPTNPGETDFRELYAIKGIGARMIIDSPTQLSLEKAGRWQAMRAISWISANGDRVLRKYVGEIDGAITSALVLGKRQAVDPRTRDLLVETGTVHLLSVSGLHLAMLAGMVRFVMLITNFSRGTQVTLILLACVFFAALTGARPPVLRAAFLVAAILIASWSAKVPNTINSLAIAAIALMILNPNNLLQTGTQLSFVAVTSLVIVGRKLTEMARQDVAIDRVIQQSRPRMANAVLNIYAGLIQSLKISFWVWAISAPLVWHAYNIISPISILSNLVIIPALAITLMLGLITTTIGILFGVPAIPFGVACKVSVSFIVWVVEKFAAVPAGHFWLPAPSGWLVILFYVGLAIPSLRSPRKPWGNQKIFYILGIGLWFGVAIPAAFRKLEPPNEDLRITFIDVGHGTSVLLELPGATGNWLYDAGRLGDPLWSISPIQDVLWSKGIYRLDGLIVSHADSDHYNAIPDLLRRFNVPRVYVSPGMLDDQQTGLDPIRLSIAEHRPKVIEISAGDELTSYDDVAWGEVLHPPLKRIGGSDNANSIVLQVNAFGSVALLPGDLEMPGTSLLLEQPRPTPGGIMMAPHHGSVSQDARPLLDWMRPSIITVSGGKRALRDQVTRMLSQTGASCHITADIGAIQLTLNPKGEWTVQHWHVDAWKTAQ